MADIQRYRSNGLLLPDGSMRYGDVAHYDDHLAALSAEREQTERYRQKSILLAATVTQVEQENKDLRERLAGANALIMEHYRSHKWFASSGMHGCGVAAELVDKTNAYFQQSALQQLADEGQARGEYK